MPSRKRTKGKQRKLKNQAREPIVRKFSHSHVTNDDNDDEWGDMSQWEQLIRLMERAKCGGCTHGCEIPPKDHPVYNFMNKIYGICVELDDEHHFLVVVKETFKNHHEVWKDAEMKKMIIEILLSFGTNLTLIDMIEFARNVTFAIKSLEQYTGEGNSFSIVRCMMEDFAYMRNSGDRDVIRFYYKRISCSCLEQKYSAIKESQDRVNKCCGCNQTKKRKDLVVCSGCKFAHYCSKQCQISDWPTHKSLCKKLQQW